MKLCPTCSKKRFPQSARPAKECGHGAAVGALKWCEACAKKKRVCQCCGQPVGRASA